MNIKPSAASPCSPLQAASPKHQPRSESADQASAYAYPIDYHCPQQAPGAPMRWTINMHSWSEAMMLGHIASEKDMLLYLLKGGVGSQPGNQLAQELTGLIYKISRLESRKVRADQLVNLSAELVGANVGSIIGGSGVMEHLSKVIDFHDRATVRSSSSHSSSSSGSSISGDAGNAFVKYCSPEELRSYVANEISTLNSLASQGVPVDFVMEESKPMLDRIRAVEDELQKTALIKQVFDWLNHCANVDPARFGELLAQVATYAVAPAIRKETGAVGIDPFHLADGTRLWSSSSAGPTQDDLLQIIYGSRFALIWALDASTHPQAGVPIAPDADLRLEFGRLLQVIARLGKAGLKDQSYDELNTQLVRVTGNPALAKEFLGKLSDEREAGSHIAAVSKPVGPGGWDDEICFMIDAFASSQGWDKATVTARGHELLGLIRDQAGVISAALVQKLSAMLPPFVQEGEAWARELDSMLPAHAQAGEPS